MSIRMIAKDIYRYRQEIERLEAALAQAPVEKRSAIEQALREAVAAHRQLKKALDGQLDRNRS